MKKFETPEIEIVNFEVEDVVTTSIPGIESNETNGLPFG